MPAVHPEVALAARMRDRIIDAATRADAGGLRVPGPLDVAVTLRARLGGDHQAAVGGRLRAMLDELLQIENVMFVRAECVRRGCFYNEWRAEARLELAEF